MTTVYMDPAVGGNGTSFSDDADPSTGMGNGGYITRLIPMLVQIVAIAANVVAKATAAAASATSAINAPGTSATSTTNLSVVASGTVSPTIQTGKALSVGQRVALARTSAPTTAVMYGAVSAYNSGTGVLSIAVDSAVGVGLGPFTDWTVSLSPYGITSARQVTGAGLATGGGDMTADRTITVTAAAASDILGGTDNSKALTSLALKNSQAPLTLTDAATVNWNMASGVNAKVTLGGNRTIAAPTNPTQGYTYALEVVQDATGGRVPVLPASFKFGIAGAPSFSTGAGKRDIIFLYCYDAATPEFRASFSRDA